MKRYKAKLYADGSGIVKEKCCGLWFVVKTLAGMGLAASWVPRRFPSLEAAALAVAGWRGGKAGENLRRQYVKTVELGEDKP